MLYEKKKNNITYSNSQFLYIHKKKNSCHKKITKKIYLLSFSFLYIEDVVQVFINKIELPLYITMSIYLKYYIPEIRGYWIMWNRLTRTRFRRIFYSFFFCLTFKFKKDIHEIFSMSCLCVYVLLYNFRVFFFFFKK